MIQSNSIENGSHISWHKTPLTFSSMAGAASEEDEEDDEDDMKKKN